MFGLGIVQLGLVQQARLLAQYAAFAAARAGVVWGARDARMHDAALLVMLTLLGRADSWEAVARSWPSPRHGGQVRVDVLSPKVADGTGPAPPDFDLPDSYPEAAGPGDAFARFTSPLGDEPDQEALRAATLLTVRVRYLHELVIPFAGWVVFTCWQASHPDDPEMEALEQVARQEHRYFLPLPATYTLRMQSTVRRP
jgi:hypothetical protein